MNILKIAGVVYVEVSQEDLVKLLFDDEVQQPTPAGHFTPGGPPWPVEKTHCRFCEKPLVPGKKVCKKHLTMLRKNIGKARGKR